MKSDNNAVTCIGLVAVILIVIVFGSIVQGWVLCTLWAWFVMPIFNVPQLSIALAIGISMVVGMLTHQEYSNNSTDSDTLTTIISALAKAFISPLLTLAFGYIVHLYV